MPAKSLGRNANTDDRQSRLLRRLVDGQNLDLVNGFTRQTDGTFTPKVRSIGGLSVNGPGLYILTPAISGLVLDGTGLYLKLLATGGLTMDATNGLYILGPRTSAGDPASLLTSSRWFWYDTTSDSFKAMIAKQTTGLGGLIGHSTTVGTTVANTAVETTIPSSTFTLTAAAMQVGKRYRMKWFLSYIAAAGNTLNLIAYLNAVVLQNAGSIVMPTTAVAKAIVVELDFTPLTIGSTGTVVGSCDWRINGQSAVTKNSGGTGVVVNTTVAVDVKLTATWTPASASNSVQCVGFEFEQMG